MEERNNAICSFKPNISSYNFSDKENSFVDRQRDFADELRSKLDLKIDQILREKFKPEINKVSNLLVRAERENETQEDKIERMTVQPLVEKSDQIHRI